MNYLICVDDTDDLTKATSTGLIAQKIGQTLVQMGAIMEEGISRHQLLLHEQICYTSHNSSMCLAVRADPRILSMAKLADTAEAVVCSHMAATADPGLAIFALWEGQPMGDLVDFGFRAKREVLTKEQAYELVQRLPNVELRELGGDGSGVIGALAGVGLRLSRCDGTFRGKHGIGLANHVMPAVELQHLLELEQIVDETGSPLPKDAPVAVATYAKLCLIGGRRSVVAVWNGNHYKVISDRRSLEAMWVQEKNPSTCAYFVPDNDEDEMYMSSSHFCLNCLFRRWTASGYHCIREGEK